MSRCQIIGASIMVSVLCASCTTVTEPEHMAHVEQATTTSAPPSARSVRAESALGKELRRVVDGAVAHHGGRAGLAVVSEGQVYSAGDPAQGAAWSTIKVPIAIAAYRAGTAEDDTARAAITYSDNDASVELWNSLGKSAEASAAVQEVLSLTGDPTDVARQWGHSGARVSFGEVSWPLSGQALFASKVQCVEGAEPVVELMGEISEEHKYGLGLFPGAVFKGGWGPDDDGVFTMRQLGVVDGVGIAMYVHPEDETESEGRAMLDDMARGLRELLAKGDIRASRGC
ncbi:MULTISPECIES: hypothetical protein [unclassified Corynebacterium]|uniref:hypothetical protein n=1 Tax=unclassified Corynebacterium TaxID=2624378 RepID=UPI0029C9FD59|nr:MULTISPECIES: hypothetical protein [unclassified Corynebacterium]WPF67101.1 hypothetical protein OLX12_05140 [Corynebacterium sp. 22KM0430]WPF69589.1 hypothetical protein OLW90_05135 [Corynebacterium sp. 21KM1197]